MQNISKEGDLKTSGFISNRVCKQNLFLQQAHYRLATRWYLLSADIIHTNRWN